MNKKGNNLTLFKLLEEQSQIIVGVVDFGFEKQRERERERERENNLIVRFYNFYNGLILNSPI